MTELEARTKCNKLVDELIRTVGGDWESNVFFNCEWYYSADLKNMSIIENYFNGEFSVSFSDDEKYPHSTPLSWSVGRSFPTPKEAVINQITTAKNFINKCADVVIGQEILFTKLMNSNKE